MDNKPQEITGEGMTFPCEFVIKVFGAASSEFESAVLEIMRKHIPEITETDIQRRPSKDGKYHVLSITINAESREQLDNIYRELTSNPLVLMAL